SINPRLWYRNSIARTRNVAAAESATHSLADRPYALGSYSGLSLLHAGIRSIHRIEHLRLGPVFAKVWKIAVRPDAVFVLPCQTPGRHQPHSLHRTRGRFLPNRRDSRRNAISESHGTDYRFSHFS